MGDHFQKSNSITVSKQESMRVISHRRHPALALDHNHYRWDSPWPKPWRMSQPSTLLIQIGSCWTHAQPSSLSYTKIFSKKLNPNFDAVEELRAYTNVGHQDYEHSAIFKMWPFGLFVIIPSLTYSTFLHWCPSPVSPSTHNCTHP